MLLLLWSNFCVFLFCRYLFSCRLLSTENRKHQLWTIMLPHQREKEVQLLSIQMQPSIHLLVWKGHAHIKPFKWWGDCVNSNSCVPKAEVAACLRVVFPNNLYGIIERWYIPNMLFSGKKKKQKKTSSQLKQCFLEQGYIKSPCFRQRIKPEAVQRFSIS